jgi:hypothetical protein
MEQRISELRHVLPGLPHHENICLVILKNTNKHALIFRVFDTRVESCWLMFRDDGYSESPTSLIDRSLMSITINNDFTLELPISVNQTCTLALDPHNRPMIMTKIDRKDARLDIVYVNIDNENMQETKVDVLGRSLDGQRVHETITVNLSWIPTSFI